jgi:hypothetical protein
MAVKGRETHQHRTTLPIGERRRSLIARVDLRWCDSRHFTAMARL